MNPAWIAKFRPLTELFMDYGWFVAPFLVGAELSDIEEAADWIRLNPPADNAARKLIEARIYKALCEPAFSTTYRARAVWYGNQLPHLSDFNHLYEVAIFSYYKREYAQSVCTLLTVFEGVLLSMAGYKFGAGQRKPSISQMLNSLRSPGSQQFAPGSDMDNGFSMYRDTLIRFLSDWLYKDTDHSDFSLSVLNRHYVLHGMEFGNFYRPEDLHRLILAYDLIIELLCFECSLFLVFLPDPGKDAFIDARRDYYPDLASGELTVKQCWKREQDLLKQHRSYSAANHDPNLADFIREADEID